MAMRILRYEAPSFVRAETLYGIAIEVDGIGVVHLFRGEVWRAYPHIDIHERLRSD